MRLIRGNYHLRKLAVLREITMAAAKRLQVVVPKHRMTARQTRMSPRAPFSVSKYWNRKGRESPGATKSKDGWAEHKGESIFLKELGFISTLSNLSL